MPRIYSRKEDLEKVRRLNKRDSKNSIAWLMREHGLTKEEYDLLYNSQDGKCKICRKELRLCIDHDHNTKVIRGLLCWPCNTLLGHVRDNIEILERVIDYLNVQKV